MNLFDLFEQNVHTYPNKPAFIYFDKRNWITLTYRDIFDQTQRFISGLEAGGYTPGMTAALLTPPNPDFFPFSLALLKIGIIPILVEPALGIKKIRDMYEESKPDIFVGNPLTHALRMIFGWGRKSVRHNLTINQFSRFTFHESSSIAHHPMSERAAIIYTSGSTGLPKGAIYTQENLAAQLELLKNTFQISQDEVDLPAFPLYALIDLLLGITSVIPDISFPVPGKTNPEKVVDAIQKFKVTNMFASPVVLDLLSSFAENNHSSSHPILLSSLKRIITAGAPATIDLQKRFRHLLANHTSLFGIYGATESLPIAKIESRDVFALEEKTKNGAGICLGKPIEGVTVRIIPITDEPIEEWQDSLTAKPNVVGEITVQSAATTREYLNRPESNRISKIEYRGEIIHRMGDVGYFDDEGRLWYCGRKSHCVITKDDVLFTEQIENIFNAHPQVFRTALVGVDGEPVLWVELEKRVRVNEDKIRRELIDMAKHHSQASTIKIFLFTKKLPTDVRHNSKIIREELAILAKKRLL